MREYRGKNYMNVRELSEYLPDRPTMNTIYVWVNLKKVPFQKFGKTILFEKDEIDQWNDLNRPVNQK